MGISEQEGLDYSATAIVQSRVRDHDASIRLSGCISAVQMLVRSSVIDCNSLLTIDAPSTDLYNSRLPDSNLPPKFKSWQLLLAKLRARKWVHCSLFAAMSKMAGASFILVASSLKA